MGNVYKTKEVLERFNISRQTLYNWCKQGLINQPIRDWRAWRMWTEENLKEIDSIINKKIYNIDQEQHINKILAEYSEENNKTFNIQNRRYLGSKYKLLNFIDTVVSNECDTITNFADVFAGTGVVASLFNKPGTSVIVNDLLYSNYVCHNAWFSNEHFNEEKIIELINYYNCLKPTVDNYVSENFGNRYFTISNALKIGAIREEIEKISDQLNFREKCILLTSLLYATDRCANTCGHYDAYREKLDTTNELKLLPLNLSNSSNRNQTYNMDANELVKSIEVDMVYIDPPYNSRQYSDTYHLLENIAKWEKPTVYGKAKKMDRANIKSKYCTQKASVAFSELINNITAKYILVSYNDMGNRGVGRSMAKISDSEIFEILSKKGKVKVFNQEYRYFTTGKTSIEELEERLFLCKCRER